MPTGRSRSRRTDAGARRRAEAPRRARAAGARAVPVRPAKRPYPKTVLRRTELERLIDLVDRAWAGYAWHGPSVLEALSGVTAADAEARPVANAHTIGELVLHMARWKRAVATRLGGRPDVPTDAENFPPFRARDWRRALAELRHAHAAVRAAIARLEPERFEVPAVPGGTAGFLQAHGIVHHDLWHAGQILVLRRALESRGR